MQRDPRAFLWDAREAALAIQTFTTGLDVTAYEINQLIHCYASVNPSTVWTIAKNSLPGLINAAQVLLDEQAQPFTKTVNSAINI